MGLISVVDGDVKWGAFLRSLNTCFINIRISPEELHNLIKNDMVGTDEINFFVINGKKRAESRRFTSDTISRKSILSPTHHALYAWHLLGTHVISCPVIATVTT